MFQYKFAIFEADLEIIAKAVHISIIVVIVTFYRGFIYTPDVFLYLKRYHGTSVVFKFHCPGSKRYRGCFCRSCVYLNVAGI